VSKALKKQKTKKETLTLASRGLLGSWLL